MLVTTKVPFGLVSLIKSKIYDEEIKASDQGSLAASCLVVCAIKSLWLKKKNKIKKSGVDERQDKLFLTSSSSGGSS